MKNCNPNDKLSIDCFCSRLLLVSRFFVGLFLIFLSIDPERDRNGSFVNRLSSRFIFFSFFFCAFWCLVFYHLYLVIQFSLFCVHSSLARQFFCIFLFFKKSHTESLLHHCDTKSHDHLVHWALSHNKHSKSLFHFQNNICISLIYGNPWFFYTVSHIFLATRSMSFEQKRPTSFQSYTALNASSKCIWNEWFSFGFFQVFFFPPSKWPVSSYYTLTKSNIMASLSAFLRSKKKEKASTILGFVNGNRQEAHLLSVILD